MKDGIIIGMALGIIVGAVVVGTNKQAQNFVEKGKNAIKKQLQNM